jgi:hypothetical protein
MSLRKLRQYYNHYARIVNALRISLLHKVKILAYLLIYLALLSKIEKNLSIKIKVKLKPVISIEDVHYKLLDLESLSTLSPMHEPWMIKYLKIRDGEIFVDVEHT